MVSLGILVLVIATIVIIFVVRSQRTSPLRRPAKVTQSSAKNDGGKVPISEFRDEHLEKKLQEWVKAGLISTQQSEAILSQETAVHRAIIPVISLPERLGPTPKRIPAVAEALGYLGGALVVVGLVLAATRYWPDISVVARLIVTGAITALLIAAGAMVREKTDPALARFRWFLWLASSATTVFFAVVLSREQFHNGVKAVVLIAALAGAIESGILWGGRNRPLQQFVFLGALAAAAGATGASLFPASPLGPMGLAVWIVGIGLLVVGLRRLITNSPMTESMGAAAIVVGAMSVSNGWGSGGLSFLLASTVSLIALAEVPGVLARRLDQLIIGLIGAFTTFESLPATLTYFAQKAGVVTGSLTWIAGLALVAAGSRKLLRTPELAKLVGGILLLGGAAITGAQSRDVAPLFGLATAIGLVVLGTRPGQVLMSALGSLGILINVTWGVSWYFPSQGRAPLLILVSGILIIAIAVWMARMRGRFASELGLGGHIDGSARIEPKHNKTGSHRNRTAS
ncbi:MAG: hypothetical protein M0Z39_01605 [Actinomycetota bacterium]|nr:hypothetical protein [Actinomycetota bacterium]